MVAPDATLRLPWTGAIALRPTLSALRRGRGDPSVALRRDGFWFAARTPAGPGTLRVFFDTPGQLSAEAWGPAAGELLLGVPGLVGLEDQVADFAPLHPVVRRLHKTHHGLRLSRTGFLLKSLVGTILGQKITTVEAHRAWRMLLQDHGERAPGPVPLWTLPAPPRLARLPGAAWTRMGVHRAQAATVSRAAAAAHHLEALLQLPPPLALERLQLLRGIGPWTANNTLLQAAGWADAVPVGDYHIKNTVAWALARRPRGTDEEMLALLAPFAPHRGRVVRLLKGAGGAPRFGPKTDVRALPGSVR
jgi:3-methyladenine DNA glycosylase/8-oxoguanine DNA glycosylase